jgi:hypothetical protein
MGAELLTGVAGWVERGADVRKDVESLLPERGRVKSKVKRRDAQLSADEFTARAAKHGVPVLQVPGPIVLNTESEGQNSQNDSACILPLS